MELPLTVGQIATTLGCPQHRIRFAVRSRNIPVAGRAGIIRLFSPAAVDQIRAALHEIKVTPRAERAKRGWRDRVAKLASK